eukprot:5099050-Pyramimonas_sp.AAC.1
MGPRSAVLGVANACGPPPEGPSLELHMGPRSSALGVADACGPPPGAVGGAPHGAAKRRTTCGGHMRAPPLGPSVELPGVADACGHRHWGLR